MSDLAGLCAQGVTARVVRGGAEIARARRGGFDTTTAPAPLGEEPNNTGPTRAGLLITMPSLTSPTLRACRRLVCSDEKGSRRDVAGGCGWSEGLRSSRVCLVRFACKISGVRGDRSEISLRSRYMQSGATSALGCGHFVSFQGYACVGGWMDFVANVTIAEGFWLCLLRLAPKGGHMSVGLNSSQETFRRTRTCWRLVLLPIEAASNAWCASGIQSS